MKLKIVSSMVVALMVSNPLCAAPDPIQGSTQQALLAPQPSRPEQQEIEPAMLVERGMTKMLAFLNQEQPPDEAMLMKFLGNEITLFFDFPYMAKSAAGPVWRYMDQQQRDRMADNIKQQFLATMGTRLTGYDNQQVKVVAQRYGRGGFTARVSVAVLQPKGYPARLDFRFYRAKTGWKVFDVSANGQSAVIHFRRQFRQNLNAARYEGQAHARQHQLHRLTSQ